VDTLRPVDELVDALHGTLEVLDESAWCARRGRHEARVDALVAPHLARRAAGRTHPVEDFLFTYYSHSPAALRRWHPGFGIALENASDYAGLKGYADAIHRAVELVETTLVTVSREYLASQVPLTAGLRELLTATAQRLAQLGCFGMHEWAMVFGLEQAEVRHSSWPLRLGAQATDGVVRSHRIACSHYDAFRFFTSAARPLNEISPRRDDRPAFEQPGCLHAGMDLYKHAYRLSPLVCSDLVADCFELARDIRALDMRASPYDLSSLGYQAVRIETSEGKAEYVAAQREFAARAAPLRGRLIDECDRLLDAADPPLASTDDEIAG